MATKWPHVCILVISECVSSNVVCKTPTHWTVQSVLGLSLQDVTNQVYLYKNKEEI